MLFIILFHYFVLWAERKMPNYYILTDNHGL